MKKIMNSIIVLALIGTSHAALAVNTAAAKPTRVPASSDYLDSAEFQKLREDPAVKKGVEVALDIFNKSGTLLFCSTPNDIDRSMALTFYGVPYRVTQMVATAANENTAGKVCVVAEKPKN